MKIMEKDERDEKRIREMAERDLNLRKLNYKQTLQ
jgi:hypothetical protein